MERSGSTAFTFYLVPGIDNLVRGMLPGSDVPPDGSEDNSFAEYCRSKGVRTRQYVAALVNRLMENEPGEWTDRATLVRELVDVGPMPDDKTLQRIVKELIEHEFLERREVSGVRERKSRKHEQRRVQYRLAPLFSNAVRTERESDHWEVRHLFCKAFDDLEEQAQIEGYPGVVCQPWAFDDEGRRILTRADVELSAALVLLKKYGCPSPDLEVAAFIKREYPDLYRRLFEEEPSTEGD
jgi:DNA-binding HxlR family transcriptional regulator